MRRHVDSGPLQHMRTTNIKYKPACVPSRRRSNPHQGLALTLGPPAPFQESNFCKPVEPANHSCASSFHRCEAPASFAITKMRFKVCCARCVGCAVASRLPSLVLEGGLLHDASQIRPRLTVSQTRLLFANSASTHSIIVVPSTSSSQSSVCLCANCYRLCFDRSRQSAARHVIPLPRDLDSGVQAATLTSQPDALDLSWRARLDKTLTTCCRSKQTAQLLNPWPDCMRRMQSLSVIEQSRFTRSRRPDAHGRTPACVLSASSTASRLA